MKGTAVMTYRIGMTIACAWLSIGVAIATPTGRIVAKSTNHRPAKKAQPEVASNYAKRADALAFVDEVVETRGLARADVLHLLADARYSATAVRLMQPAPTAVRRDWSLYRSRVVEPIRIAAGVRFWADNVATLRRAETAYGIPAEIIVGIIGVETIYGRDTGTFRVLDALTTLAFDYPNKKRDRSSFFRGQLADAMVLARDNGTDLRTLRGSYAGAIGMPQFMPGSILNFAVDFDEDGRIDLVNDNADVIGSVANFLAGHGWVRGLVTHVGLSRLPSSDPDIEALGAAKVDALVESGSVPSLDLSALASAGFIADAFPPDAKFALIDLPGGDATTYIAGTQNFHVITRYNRSYFYALSVIELGTAVKAAYESR
jgi:membrane-bound lytic murein transglycosylase B